MNYVEPIRDIEKVKDITQYLKTIDEKYYIMFKIGLYSGLRVSDILKLRVRDVKNKDKIKIIEKKTGKAKFFPIRPSLKKEINNYCNDKEEYEFLIPSTVKGKAISREYAWKVLKHAGKAVGVENIGTHSMRKTFGYHFYIETHDVVMLQKLFNHSHPSVTLRYIGITQDELYDAMNVVNFE